MLLNRVGAKFLFFGETYAVGDHVIAAAGSEYAGLSGVIVEIRDGEDKETENDGPDIYCRFELPKLEADVKEKEAIFSDLYQQEKKLEDIGFDLVIMSPDMLILPESLPRERLYFLKESWAYDGEAGSNMQVFTDEAMAHGILNETIAHELETGKSCNWINNEVFVSEHQKDGFVIWEAGHFDKNHYMISLQEGSLRMTRDFIGNVGRKYQDQCKVDDLISVLFPEDENIEEDDIQTIVNSLKENEIQQLIADQRIADMVDSKLGDGYYGAYWEAVKEAAKELLREYLKTNGGK